MLVQFPGVLIVDDDVTILRSLQVNLGADGFDVYTATSGSEALELLQRKLPDLVLVDLLLPDVHGFELSRRIKRFFDLPIIMLTAVGTEDSIVEGLDLYADDYVVKPFGYRELLARIHRVLKRTEKVRPKERTVVDSNLTLDFARRVAIMKERDLALTPAETRLLAVLARNSRQVVPTDKLIDAVWPDGEGDPSRLWVCVRRLRKKLEEDPGQPRRLVTERGIGYRLCVQE